MYGVHVRRTCTPYMYHSINTPLCAVVQTADEQSLVERLLRDNRVQNTVWLSGRLQQTTNMAYNYRWISGLSSFFDLRVQVLPSCPLVFSMYTSGCSRMLFRNNAPRTQRSQLSIAVYSMEAIEQ